MNFKLQILCNHAVDILNLLFINNINMANVEDDKAPYITQINFQNIGNSVSILTSDDQWLIFNKKIKHHIGILWIKESCGYLLNFHLSSHLHHYWFNDDLTKHVK